MNPTSTCYATETTGFLQFYDMSHSGMFLEASQYVAQYLTQQSVRNAVHVGDVVYNMSSQIVYDLMVEDWYRSAQPNLTAVMDNNYKVLLFTGNFYILVGVDSTNGMLYNQSIIIIIIDILIWNYVVFDLNLL